MRNNYIIIRKRALSLDSFRYTDHRQYIAKRDDGALQPCIHSALPFFLGLIGICMLAIVAMVVFMVPTNLVDLDNLAGTTFFGFAFAAFGGGLMFGDYRLMYAVGPKCYDGRRRFWFEEEEAKDRRMVAQADHPHRRLGDRK